MVSGASSRSLCTLVGRSIPHRGSLTGHLPPAAAVTVRGSGQRDLETLVGDENLTGEARGGGGT